MTSVVHITASDISLAWLLQPQLRAFEAAGYDVIGMSATGDHVDDLLADGVRHVALVHATRRPNFVADVRLFAELVGHLRRLRPDIVHTHTPKVGILGRIAAHVCRVPLVINTQHGLYAQPTDRRRRRWPVYLAEAIAARCSDLELVQSAQDADTLVRRLRVPPAKVIHIGNGIDLERFTADDGSGRRRMRARWGIGDDAVVVGCVGRVTAEKGIAEMLEAARSLQVTHPTAVVVWVGPADGDEIDADAPIRWVGTETDMPAAYAAFDLFVSASHREGMPRALIESQAMGLAAIASDIRGCREVVADGTTGVLVPVRRPEQLAKAVAAMVDDPDARTRMGAAARDRARRLFDQSTVISATLDAYAMLARTGSRLGTYRPSSPAR